MKLLKFVEAEVTFREVPDEISLCINLSNCPHRCVNCHSPHLQTDVGTNLTTDTLLNLIENNSGITCVALMGGDANPNEIAYQLYTIKHFFPNLKTCWYSGNDDFLEDRNLLNSILDNLDYLKIGSYKEEFGPLDSPTTNQKFFKVNNRELINVTYLFQNVKSIN